MRSDADQNEDAGHGVVVEMLLKAGCDPLDLAAVAEDVRVLQQLRRAATPSAAGGEELHNTKIVGGSVS